MVESSLVDLKQVWHDVEPIPQYEGGLAPIAPIHYSEEYTTIMGYFRAVLKSREISQRAYQLTGKVINVAAGNYTAWHYRRVLIDELKISLIEEMDYLRKIGPKFEKNY